MIDLRGYKKSKKIISRDIQDRDSAVCYIDGEFIEGNTHADCLNEYLKNKIKEKLNTNYARPPIFDKGYDETDLKYLPSEFKDDIQIIKNNIKQAAFAHLIKGDIEEETNISIFIERDTLYNISINEAIKLFKQHYPDEDIFIDETSEKVAKDLRRVVASVKIKPTDSKEDNFHLALAEYLYKELKHNQINVIKHNVTLKIALKNKHKDKYEHVVVDCMDGNMYLRGKSVKDQYFGKLRRFEGGQRASDAFHCVAQSAARIINRIKQLEDNLLNEIKEVFGEVDLADLRSSKFTDMRKHNINDLRKLARRDISDRDEMDGAIVYIDGEVLSDESHGKCISKYLESKVNKPLNHGYSRPIGFDPMFLNLDYEIEYGKKDKEDMENIMSNIKQMAFAHKDSKNNLIYVEEPSLYNISLSEASNAIKAAYPNYDIYSDDTEEKVAKKDLRLNKTACLKIDDLRKVAGHDYNNRSWALAYIDGEIIEGITHANCINRYLKKHSDAELNIKWMRPKMKEDEIENDDQAEDFANIMGTISQMAFAHKASFANAIYIESSTLYNIELQTVVDALKKEYPEFEIYDDDSNDSSDPEEYKRLAKDLRKIKIADLRSKTIVSDLRKKKTIATDLRKLSRRDIRNRDCALAYIDGELVEGYTHAKCIDKYLAEHFNLCLNDDHYRPILDENKLQKFDESTAEDYTNIVGSIQQIAFAHKIECEKVISIEENSLYNIDLDQVAQTIKTKYPDYLIIKDENNKKLAKIDNRKNKLRKLLRVV